MDLAKRTDAKLIQLTNMKRQKHLEDLGKEDS